MALIVKSTNEKNESPQFLQYRKHFAWLQQTTLIAMAVEFFILIFVIVANFSNEGIGRICLISIVILGITLKIQDRQLTDFQTLIPYKAFVQRRFDEEALARAREGKRAFSELTKEMLSDDYVVLENLYLPHDGKYLQKIDSLIIGPSGSLYLVEAKNWPGVISANIDDREWLTDGGLRKSPYFENKYHADTLRRLLSSYLDEHSEVHNLMVNMEPASHLNICKFDKEEHLIYQDAGLLHEWIREHEETADLLRVEKQVQLVCSLLDLHFEALSQVEVEINRELLEKYDLVGSLDEYTVEPQFS